MGSFFIFQQFDMVHTTTSSLALLKGHFLDFYDYNVTVVEGNGYLISTYIAFAIWNLPIYLLGLTDYSYPLITPFALFYAKFFVVAIYFLSAYILYKIGLQIGLGKSKSQLLAIIFISTPIAFFSQFMFGQYDILTVFFMLLGLLYYFKGSKYKYLIFFGIAITFKYHALVLALPLIFLKEKNIFKLALYGVIITAPFALEVLLFFPSEAFLDGVFGFRPISYFKFHTYVAFILLFIFSYFKKVNDEDKTKWAIFYLSVVSFIMFGLASWHPQWLLLVMPFLALAVMVNKRPNTLLIIDMILMLLLVHCIANHWSSNVDQGLFSLGVLRNYLPDNLNTFFPMSEMTVRLHRDLNFILFAIPLFVRLYLSHPKFNIENLGDDNHCNMNLIRLRFVLGTLLFIVPAFISLFVAKYFGA